MARNKFRLGNHQLHIKTGVHTVPKSAESLRLCKFCKTNEIENEVHFLLSCKFCESFRLKLFNEITEKYVLFKDLDKNSKLMFLFNSIDPVICRL